MENFLDACASAFRCYVRTHAQGNKALLQYFIFNKITHECIINSIIIFDILIEYNWGVIIHWQRFNIFGGLKDFVFIWWCCIDFRRFERSRTHSTTPHRSTFDFYLLIYIYVHYSFWFVIIASIIYSIFWMTFCSIAFCNFKRRSWHYWQMRDNFVQTSIIRLYGAFCKHHGHRTILCENWRQLLAQKQYEKKEISLQARIGFSQIWWCPNQLDFQFFTIAILLLQPFCHLRVARQRRNCFRASQSWNHK